MVSIDATAMSLQELLASRIAIDSELTARGISRTSGSLAGELAERLALAVYGGELVPPAYSAIDLIAADGRRVQVKARALPAGDQRFFSFKSLDFDVALCVRFDRASFEVEWAREYTAAEVESSASRQKEDWRLRTGRASATGSDLTEVVRAAYLALDGR